MARLQWFRPLVAKYADGDLQTFATKVDIDRSTVSQLYHDHRELTDKYAIRISNRLHIQPPKDMALQAVVKPEPVPDLDNLPKDEVLTILKTQTHLLNAALDRLESLTKAVELLAKR